MRLFLVFAFLAFVGLEARVRYDNYKVYEMIPEDEMQLTQIAGLRHSYDFWQEPHGVGSNVQVMVHPNETAKFEAFLRKNGIMNRVEVHNVQDLVDADELSKSDTLKMNWWKFQSLASIYLWLNYTMDKYPFVSLVKGGESYEGRTILGIEINFGSSLPGVVIESGIHAREWLAPAGTSWFVNEILKSKKKSIFRKFNYLYFPVCNPDGYEYSWNTVGFEAQKRDFYKQECQFGYNPEDRLWRKTRKPYKAPDGSVSYGVDPNRNFAFHWQGNTNPFSEVYPGPKPFSEVETATFSKYLQSVAEKRRNDIYLSYHTSGDYFMYPWAWTTDGPPNEETLDKVAQSGADAWSNVYGSDVIAGQISKVLYQANGTATDWYYNQFNCTLAFAFQMRGRSFITSPRNIVKAGREHLVSLKQILIEYKKIKKGEKTAPPFH